MESTAPKDSEDALALELQKLKILEEKKAKAVKYYEKATILEAKGDLNSSSFYYNKAYHLYDGIDNLMASMAKPINVDVESEAEEAELIEIRIKNYVDGAGPITKMNIELLLLIFSFLRPSSLISIRSTCLFFYSLAKSRSVWTRRLELETSCHFSTSTMGHILDSFLLSKGIVKTPYSHNLNDLGNCEEFYWNGNRIRFNGVYICRIRYLRPGQTEYGFVQPVHIVTYFRYLRFYPDGSVLSMVTPQEPQKIVKVLFKKNLKFHEDMRMGRFACQNDRLFAVLPAPNSSKVANQVFFRIELKLKVSSDRFKLSWKQFESFDLQRDQISSLECSNPPFIFSKVRSYGSYFCNV